MGTASEAYLHLTLNNADKRFSPENSSGPLYGNLAPLRPLRVTSDDGSTVRTHWSGWINMIEPAANKYGARQANILATGAMQFLKATETKIELQENQRSDQVIDALIQEVIFPAGAERLLGAGRSGLQQAGRIDLGWPIWKPSATTKRGVLTLNMAGDNWVRQGGYSDQEKDTFDVYRGIRDITAAERGKFFFDREGKAVFWNRHHILDDDVSGRQLQ